MMRQLLVILLSLCVLAACQAGGNGQSSANAPGASGGAQSSALTSSANPSSSGLSAEVQRLIQAAKEKGETHLDLSWSANSIGGSEGAARYEVVFNRMYGTNIKINFTPGPSFPNMAGKITQEAQAGQKASTDALIGSDDTFTSILDQNALEPYDYTLLSPRITSSIVAPRNVGVEIYSTMPGILYNTNLVRDTELPKKLEDTLSPRWKGKIASDVDAAYFDVVASRPDWGADRMKAFLTQLSANVGGLIRVGEETRVATGEFQMMVLGNTHAVLAKPQGAPLNYVITDDAAGVRFVYLGVPKTSGSPNLAKLFINMIVSPEGQKTVFDVYAADHYALPGSQSGKDLQALKARGGTIAEVNIQYDLAHPELAKLVNEMRQILREKVS